MLTLPSSTAAIKDWTVVYGGVCRMRYTLVWCTKHSRDVLIEPVVSQITPLFYDVVRESGGDMQCLQIHPSWIFCEVELASPHISPAQLVHHIKSSTSALVRRDYPDIRRRLKSLWTRSFFIATAEYATDKQIALYIASQGSR